MVIGLQCFRCEQETCFGMGLISPFFILAPSLPSMNAVLGKAKHDSASSSQNSSQNSVVIPSHPGAFSLPSCLRAFQHSSFVNGASMLIAVVGLTLSCIAANTWLFAWSICGLQSSSFPMIWLRWLTIMLAIMSGCFSMLPWLSRRECTVACCLFTLRVLRTWFLEQSPAFKVNSRACRRSVLNSSSCRHSKSFLSWSHSVCSLGAIVPWVFLLLIF